VAIRKDAEKAFSGLTKTNFTPVGPVDYTGSEIRIRDDRYDVVQTIYGFEVCGYNNPLYWAIIVLKALVGSWTQEMGTSKCSRLAELISVEKLAHLYTSTYTVHKTTGLFTVYTESEEEHMDDLSYEILKEFQNLASYLPPQEILWAKNQVKRNYLNSMEVSSTFSDEIGYQLLTARRRLSPSEVIARIDAVTPADVQSALNDYFYDVDPVVVCHGKIGEFTDYNILRNWTYWNRW